MREQGRGETVQIDQVTKVFPKVDQVAVSGVNLSIEASEFMTFLGPSGSGKSTMLGMIAGFFSPTHGTIRIGGTDVANTPANKRDIGMVFQQYALFPHLTAAENVAYPLRRRGLGGHEIDSRVTETLRKVHLLGFEQRYPAELSGGQQQRVAVARSIVYEPRVLLMDEPLGALDRKLREGLQLEISRLHRDVGSTFVYVTHDQEEALALSDRIAVFREGKIEQVGPPDQLYAEPTTLFVAQFLGESNVFRGRRESRAFHESNGQSFRLPASKNLPESETALVVRPEHLHVLTEGMLAENSCNVMPATVTEAIFLGSYRKLVLRRSAGQEITVREVAGQYSSARPGDAVRLFWHPECSRLVGVT